MQTLPGLLPTAARPSSALPRWSHGGATAVPVALAALPGIYTRAHQRQPQHHGSAPQPWLSVKPQNAPVKPSANTDTGVAGCTVLLLLTMGGFKVNYCSYPFIPMSRAGLPASACSPQCCFSFMELIWFGWIWWLWMDR